MKTQGEKLAAHLRRSAHTYLEMNLLCVSVSPHKRVAEFLSLNPQYVLKKGKRGDLTTWRIVRAKKAS